MLQPIAKFGSQRPSELIIRNVPAHMVRRLRERALEHGRTLQDELYSILESALAADEPKL